MGIETEIPTFLTTLGVWWMIVIAGGIIYGISKKVGTALIIIAFAFVCALTAFVLLEKGLEFLTIRIELSRMLGAAVAGFTSTTVFSIGKELGIKIRENFTN